MLDTANLPPRIAVVSTDQAFDARLRVLAGGRWTLETHRDAIAALDTLFELPPELILVDEGIPPKGGFQAIREFHVVEELQSVPMLFCGRSADTMTRENALDAGAAEVLKKTAPEAEIAETLSEWISRRVEKTWNDLPETPRKALSGTVQAYKLLSDSIRRGDPVPFEDSRDSCVPLIEAVEGGSFATMLDGVKGHDNYTYVHSFRVATLLSLFGHTIGMKGPELMVLAVGGLVHDLGKMAVPHAILNKPARLEPAEMGVMKGHVEHTLSALESVSDLPLGVRLIAAQHHEKLDGTGYPRGLKADKLNDLARMAAICDIFGALTDRRPYKEALSPEAAFDILEGMDGQIDMRLLALFKGMLEAM